MEWGGLDKHTLLAWTKNVADRLGSYGDCEIGQRGKRGGWLQESQPETFTGDRDFFFHKIDVGTRQVGRAR